MSDPKTFKPVTLEQLGLSPDEMKILVDGAQRFLPPVDSEEDTTKPTVDREPKNPSL